MKLAQPQAIRTIFFDAGFTLLQPNPSMLDVVQRVCRQFGLELEMEQLRCGLMKAEDFRFQRSFSGEHIWAYEQAINDFWLAYYKRLLQALLREDEQFDLDRIASAVFEEFTKHSNWQLYPDVQPTLEAFQAKGYSLGVISDWGIALAPILRQFGLTKYFDCVIISAIARHAKPSPMLYDIALERINAIADYSIHVGDSYIQDVLGARAAGITPILLDRPKMLTKEQIDCLLVHSLHEMIDLLEV